MHLIQRMKIWKDLRRLEQRVREEPSPTTFVDLGQVYINLECHDKAVRVAEDGQTLFPRSGELRKLLDCARRGLSKQRITALKAKIVRAPTARIYRELAELQMDLGDTAGLNVTCQEWSLRFPGDADAWLILGQARMLAFYRDLAAREGQEAMRYLDRAVSMDAESPQAQRLLGEMLYRVGAVSKSMACLEALRDLHRSDPELEALLAYVAGLEDKGEDVDRLLGEVEERGSLTYPLQTAAVLAGVAEPRGDIRDGLGRIAMIQGVHKAAYIKGKRALVKGQIRDGRDPFLRIVRVVAKAAHRFGRRLDIGNAVKNVVESDLGLICVCVYGDALAGVQCDRGVDTDRLLADLQEIVAGSLCAAGGRS